MPGNLINPLIVEGQIHGGLAQGIGQAMIEEVGLRRGRPAADRLVHGLRDAAGDRLSALRAGRDGDADAGESARREGRAAKPARSARRRASSTAAVDALSEFGVKHIDMMLRPEKLWRIIHGRPGVIPTSFDYARATSLDDALARLRAANGGGKLLAGGHSLIPLMKLRLSEPQLLIDIARIPGLSGIREKGGKIEIGAATTHHEVATSALLREQVPGDGRGRREIGDPQVRNRGTMGGSLAHADPAADYPAVMLALDAEIHIKGPRAGAHGEGERLLPGAVHGGSAAGRDHRRRAVHAGQSAAAYAKLHQRASHFAIVGVGGGARGERRHDHGGAHRPDRRGHARDAADDVEEALAGQAADGRDDCRGARRWPATASTTSTPTSTPARSIAAR